MQNLMPASCLGLLSLGAPAYADLAHFEYALSEACMQNIPELKNAPDMFEEDGWYGGNTAGTGNYKFHAEGTTVFLYKNDPEKYQTCAVTDPTVSKQQAEWMLELKLDEQFPLQWEKTTNTHDQSLWNVFDSDTTTIFTIGVAPKGGAILSFEVRQ